MTIAIIAALAANRAIGREGKIPWKIPTDMKHFVELTSGHPVIMGRKTYESIPPKFRPLDKGRTSIVITRKPSGVGFETNGIVLTRSLTEALGRAAQIDQQITFVAGGSEIYNLALPVATTLYLTRICDNVEGDTFFPKIPGNEWRVTEQSQVIQGGKDQYPIVFETLVRK